MTEPITDQQLDEIAEAHPGDWYSGEWRSEYVEASGDDESEAAYYRVFHRASGAVLATLPDWAGPIALFIADAHDTVPALVAEVRRLRDRVAGQQFDEQRLAEYESAARNAARIGSGIDPAAVLELAAEVRRSRTRTRFLLGALARKDARTGEGDRALREFLAAPEAADAPLTAEQSAQAPEPHPAAETAPQAERIRALALLEAADFLRDAHHRYGLNVQEIGTALRRTADEADPMVGSLARDGLGLNEIDDMLATPAAPPRRLEDGSTHTVQALTDAGEECVQQRCPAARQEAQLRQEAYTLRGAVEGVLDEVRDMADDEQLSAEAAGVLRERLRSALGLDRHLT